MKHVLVTGATGFIGPKLVRTLRERGDRVVVLGRNPAKATTLLGADVDVIADLAELPSTRTIDAVVNLAGAPIAGGLWTARRRARLLDSRLGVTRALLELCARLEAKPATWINASAIGYYGARAGDELVDETAPTGTGFQAELCRRWEETAAQAAAHGVHVSALRFGVVLGRDGGALPQYALPIRLYAGTVLGSGRQWLSWIHIDDLVQLVLFVLDTRTLTGALNATAPEPVRNADFYAALAATLKRPLWPVRIPAPLVRAALGELAELFVDGQRVVPKRALELGFRFKYPEVEGALSHLLAPRPTS
jgi:uncharacterized protein (TIGR01777 family)